MGGSDNERIPQTQLPRHIYRLMECESVERVCGIEGVDECFHTTLYQDCWARQYTLERTHTLEMWSRGVRKAKRKQITTGARERERGVT